MATVRLTFTDLNSGPLQEDEIRVYRATAPFDITTLPSILATLAADSLTYDDATAIEGTTYYYAVAAEKDGGLAVSFHDPLLVPATGLIYTVTIPSATVGSDLTNFPVLIQLDDMPSSFWTGVRTDGGNIRAFDVTEVTEYPLDIIVINPEAQTGTIAVKVPSVTAATDTEFKLLLDDLAEVRRARSAATGMKEVWEDYEAVFMGGEYNANRAKTTGDFEVIGDVVTFENVSTIQTFSDDPHQGGTWHRASGNLYTFDNNKLVRYSSAGAVLATNSDPCGDATTFLGGTTLTHVCDGTVYNNWIVIPINNFPTDTVACIAVFDRLTLAFVTATNIAVAIPISGLCYRPDTNRLYSCQWDGSDRGALRRWTINSTTGAVGNDGTISLDDNPVNAWQGVEWWNGHFWLSDDSRDEIIRVNADGSGPRDAGLIGFDYNGGSVTGNFEGIFAYKDGLGFLVDPTSADSYMTYARPLNMAFGGGGAIYGTNNGYIERSGLAGGTTFTFGISAKRSAAKQASLLSYRDFSSGATNDRATLTHRFVTPNYRVEMWDNVNSWLTISTPVNSLTSAFNRVVGVYSGTTRKLYCDGVEIGSGTGITARDADFDCLSVGIDDETVGESFDGDLTFAYVRLGALSADWIEAEHLMISAPATFYTIA